VSDAITLGYQDAAALGGLAVAAAGLYWQVRRAVRADMKAEREVIASERAALLEQHQALNARLQDHIDRMRKRLEALEARESTLQERLRAVEAENRRLRALLIEKTGGDVIEFERLQKLRPGAA
jgi:predicted nuclease with TOPRIM domain